MTLGDLTPEQLHLLQHGLEALLVNLRVERHLAPPDGTPEIDQYGKRVRALSDELAAALDADRKAPRCATCLGRGWVGVSDPGFPFSSWRRRRCGVCRGS